MITRQFVVSQSKHSKKNIHLVDVLEYFLLLTAMSYHEGTNHYIVLLLGNTPRLVDHSGHIM